MYSPEYIKSLQAEQRKRQVAEHNAAIQRTIFSAQSRINALQDEVEISLLHDVIASLEASKVS